MNSKNYVSIMFINYLFNDYDISVSNSQLSMLELRVLRYKIPQENIANNYVSILDWLHTTLLKTCIYGSRPVELRRHVCCIYILFGNSHIYWPHYGGGGGVLISLRGSVPWFSPEETLDYHVKECGEREWWSSTP